MKRKNFSDKYKAININILLHNQMVKTIEKLVPKPSIVSFVESAIKEFINKYKPE